MSLLLAVLQVRLVRVLHVGLIAPNNLDPVRKMSHCKQRLHYKMHHNTSEGETFTINYHFDPSFPEARWGFLTISKTIIDQRYEAWEVAREASLQSTSFERGMRRRLLGVTRKVNCDEQLRLRVRQLCDDALIR